MATLRPKLGVRYLTATGTVVQILKVHEDGILAQSLASDNRFYLPREYPFCPFQAESAVWDMRPRLYIARSERPKSPRVVPHKQLAPIIDVLLMEGGRTMRGLVREVKRRASSACRGKDVRANIRARIYWLRKKGRRVNIRRLRKIVGC